MKILNMLVRKVNEVDTAEGTGIDGEELINWYLEEMEGEMDNEEEYHNEKALVKKVIKRMMKVSFGTHTHILEKHILTSLIRTISSWPSAATVSSQKATEEACQTRACTTSCILTVRLRRWISHKRKSRMPTREEKRRYEKRYHALRRLWAELYIRLLDCV